jgi:Kef-type K+ transport system membrane component KefB
MFEQLAHWFQNIEPSILFIFGVLIIASFFFSILAKKIKLPAIVAYMAMGIILGPSVTGLLNENLLNSLDFLTKALLAFVAFKIGLEIDIQELKQKGRGIITTALTESTGALIIVVIATYLVTGDWALSLLLGAVAPASAPAGTMAVIEEYKTKGPLTHAMLSIVGIDDGIGVIIFGLVTPVAHLLITQSGGAATMDNGIIISFLKPFIEIAGSLLMGYVFGKLFIITGKERKSLKFAMTLTFGFVIMLSGIAQVAELSFILANMTLGITIGNDHKHKFMKDIEEKDIGIILPLFFLLFFTIAGANLHIKLLPELGLIGIIYIIGRLAGKFSGACLGAKMGKMEPKIQHYLGFGILSQAGVAIGLSLILKQQFSGVGPLMEGTSYTIGDYLGNTVFTTITATSVFFEIFGPISAKFGLKKAGEINK